MESTTGTRSSASDSTLSTDILIIGAGPTGLTAAAEALRHKLTVRIIDRKKSRVTDQSRALVVHARTLELLNTPTKSNQDDESNNEGERASDSDSISSNLVDAGIPMEYFNIHFPNETIQMDIMNLPWDNTNFPMYLMLPQYDTEKTIENNFVSQGGTVEWLTSVKNIVQNDKFVETTLTSPDGKEEKVRSRWVIGCDGGRSQTRDLIDVCMEREKKDLYIIIADFKTNSDAFSNTCVNLYQNSQGILGIFPLSKKNQQQYRIFARPADGEDMEELKVNSDYLNNLLAQRIGIKDLNCYDITWGSYVKISYGVADSYRSGRIFLAGDACHVHSPAGGQGMNYGIQDSINLIWKLAWAKRCDPDANIDAILNSYEAERRKVAVNMLAGTRFATNFGMSNNPFLWKLKELVLPCVMKTQYFKKNIFVQTMPMFNLAYGNNSPVILKNQSCVNLSSFICKPGERLPNLKKLPNGTLYECVDRSRHSWVVVCNNDELMTLNYVGRDEGPGGLKLVHAVVDGIVRRQTLLVRPDLYVAGVHEDIDELWEQMTAAIGVDACKFM